MGPVWTDGEAPGRSVDPPAPAPPIFEALKLLGIWEETAAHRPAASPCSTIRRRRRFHLPALRAGYQLAARGFAMEHSHDGCDASPRRRALARARVARARVVALDDSAERCSDGWCILEVAARRGLRARLLVGSDGAEHSADPPARRYRPGTVARVEEYYRLPVPWRHFHAGYGTVFFGGPALRAGLPGERSSRAHDVRRPRRRWVSAPYPQPSYPRRASGGLRTDAGAMAERRGLVSTNFSILPQRVAERRVMLVGDAAGCCRPLTATGFSVCTRDTMRLRDAFCGERGGSRRGQPAPVLPRASSRRTRPRPGRDRCTTFFVARGPDAPGPPPGLATGSRGARAPARLDGAPLDSGGRIAAIGRRSTCTHHHLHDAWVFRLARAPRSRPYERRACSRSGSRPYS